MINMMQKMRESYPTDILKNDDHFIWIAVENQQLILKSLADLSNKVTFNQVGLNEVHIKLEAAQKSNRLTISPRSSSRFHFPHQLFNDVGRNGQPGK